MTEKKLVSVIIPTYNRAEYLKQAIESVLAQSYSNFELLILDNCSPDNTPEIVAKFTDPRIKYLRHQCNIRGLANWSYGVYWAKGEVISILGDDDWYMPDFIYSRVKAFNEYNEILAVFSNYDTCYQNGSDSWIKISQDAIQEKILTGKELLNAAVTAEWFLGATLYKRDVVLSIFEKCLMAGKAGDLLLNIYIAMTPNSKVVRICDKEFVYRRHSEQDTVLNLKSVCIGHIAACTLPLLEEEYSEYRKILENSASKFYNILGRTTWDSGHKQLARSYFKQQLILEPFNVVTWSRYFRCFFY
jgi:glycosyltransferase involved in cell wall biosynthesis